MTTAAGRNAQVDLSICIKFDGFCINQNDGYLQFKMVDFVLKMMILMQTLK